MTLPFCGLCTRTITGRYPRYLDGVRICDSCADDEPAAYDSDRGYTAPGGVGHRFMQQVTDAHDAIVPRAVVELDTSVTIAPATEQMPDSVPLRFRRDLGRWEK